MTRPDVLVFVDTETTGLDPVEHELLEVAVIKEVDGVVTDRWVRKIKPTHLENAEPKALEANGYSPEKWADAVPFETVAQELADLIGRGTMVGHNVNFDAGFIGNSLKRAGVKANLNHHAVDTLTLAREHLRPCGIGSLRLDNIREFLGWSLDGAHTALVDAEDARRLYYLLLRASVFSRMWWQLRARVRGVSR